MDKKLALMLLSLGGILYFASRQQPQITALPGQANSSPLLSTIGDYIVSALGGKTGINAMRAVDRNLLYHPQIMAFLRVIRKGEGTADMGGYNRLFGGNSFPSYSRHPNILVVKNGYRSTAAGAYQFLKSTWDETAQAMGLPDFTPFSQDVGALGRLAFRGAIDDILAGRFDDALKKTAREWASLPGSPYGQPTISRNLALAVFKDSGGTVAA